MRGHLVKMLITLETLYILHHSAGNVQLAFHSLVLTPDTDSSTFTKGYAHYGQLILVYVWDIGKQRSTRWDSALRCLSASHLGFSCLLTIIIIYDSKQTLTSPLK